MSQIKLKRLSFRVRWENAAKGGLAECPKELLRKQTRKTARQTDRQRDLQMRRQRDEWRDSSGSHYVYAACDDDNKKTAYQMLLKRKQRQRPHAGTPSGIYMAEREKYGKGEHTKQNKISTRLLSVCVCLRGGEGGRWKTKTCKAKAARHHTRPWREG